MEVRYYREHVDNRDIRHCTRNGWCNAMLRTVLFLGCFCFRIYIVDGVYYFGNSLGVAARHCWPVIFGDAAPKQPHADNRKERE